MQLKDNVALVTGASRGIGLSIARTLAANGADIAIVDVLAEAAAEAAATLAAEFGIRAKAWQTDVSDFGATERMVKEVIEEFGQVTVLVNNAGITKDALIVRMTEEQWDTVVAVNLKGVFNCTRHVSVSMLRNRRGSIINIASVSGQMGNSGQANYAATKAGIIGFTKTVARELAAKGVRANAIAPGYIRTEMTEQIPEAIQDELKKIIPMKRLGTPEDIAQATLFLASNASAYITGQVLAVNGGMYM
jgi:3-oxoacyl-[acyl-carrier protein] reductase